MVKVKDAVMNVKEYWVKTYCDEGFYNDEVYYTIVRTYKKEPTKAAFAMLEKTLTPNGYEVALMLIEVYRNRRLGMSRGFRGTGVCGTRLPSSF